MSVKIGYVGEDRVYWQRKSVLATIECVSEKKPCG